MEADLSGGLTSVIERASTSDTDSVLKLCYLAYQTEAQLYDDWTIPPLRETYHDLLRAIEENVVLVARYDGEVVGSVRGSLRDKTVDVGRLVVHPRLQRHGIG